MSKILKSLLMFVAVVCVSASVGFAVPPKRVVDEKIVDQVQKYMNNLQTLSTDFVQTSSNGGVAKGHMYIKKPGKMRINYDSGMFLVADGENLIYYDVKTKQRTVIDLKSTPAGILVRENLKIRDSDIVVEETDRDDINTYITMSLKADAGLGVVTFVFDKKTGYLKGWMVVDAQGITTRFNFKRAEEKVAIADKIFEVENKKEYGADGEKDGDDYY